MTLMKATLTLTAGASEDLQAQLLQNAPKLMEIAKAANALNPTLGDTAYMYESIATGIKRGSPLILDNLCIMVKVEEANQNYAESLGKTVEELSAAEKQMALLNATVEAGDRLIQQAGGTVAGYGDAWAQLRTELKNTTDAGKAAISEFFRPLFEQWATGLQRIQDNEEALSEWRATFYGLTWVMRQNKEATQLLENAWMLLNLQNPAMAGKLVELINDLSGVAVKEERAGNAARASADKVKILNDELEREIEALKRLAGYQVETGKLTSSMSTLQEENAWKTGDSAKAFEQYNLALERHEEMLGRVATASYDARQEQERLERLAYNERAAMAISAEIRSDLTERLEEGAQTLSDLRAEQAQLTLEIDKLTASHGRAVTIQKEATMTAVEMNLVTLQLADAQAKLAEETDPLKQAQLAVRIEDLSGKLGGASEATVTYINNTKKIDELKGKYSELAGEIDGVTAAIKESINSFMIQNMEAVFARDGWTDAEREVFLQTAVTYGMMDENHANLIRTLETQAEKVDEVGESYDEAMKNVPGVISNVTWETRHLQWEYITAGREGVNAFQSMTDPTMKQTMLEWEFNEELKATTERYTEVGETSHAAMEKVNAGTGSAVALMIELGLMAVEAQKKIDEMHGKEITMTINEVIHRAVGSTTDYRGQELFQQHGGDYIVNRPTPFIAGEAGAERAIFIPQGKPGFNAPLAQAAGGAGRSIGELNIYVSGTADPYETSRLVIQELQGRGLMQRMPLR
jgi:hypothetical protein